MHRIKARLTALIPVLLFTFSSSLSAEGGLALSCNIIFDHFAGIGNAAISKDIVLTSSDLRNQGLMVADRKGYEFWAMIHSVQQTGSHSVINNFQVAIRDKINNLFMSALSDSVHTPGQSPHYARITLAVTQGNGEDESGDLLFECRHFE